MKKYLQISILTVFFLVVGGFSLKAQKPVTIPKNPAGTVNRCQLFMPNAFTPNGDNINDFFTVKYNEECQMAEFDIKIFDRWGRLVYESDGVDPLFAWDGTSDGKEQKEGVYMWKLYAKLVDPAKAYEAYILNKQGTVVLIR